MVIISLNFETFWIREMVTERNDDCHFSGDINPSSILKNVQCWIKFLKKLGNPLLFVHDFIIRIWLRRRISSSGVLSVWRCLGSKQNFYEILLLDKTFHYFINHYYDNLSAVIPSIAQLGLKNENTLFFCPEFRL